MPTKECIVGQMIPVLEVATRPAFVRVNSRPEAATVSCFFSNCLEYRQRYCIRVPAELSAISNSWFR